MMKSWSMDLVCSIIPDRNSWTGVLYRKCAGFRQNRLPEQILENLLGDLGVEFTDTLQTRFHCNCSKERVSKAIISIGKKELQSMIDDGEEIEVNCHFCNTHYHYSVDDLKRMLEEATH